MRRAGWERGRGNGWCGDASASFFCVGAAGVANARKRETVDVGNPND